MRVRVRGRGWGQEADDSPRLRVQRGLGKLVQTWGPQGLQGSQQPQARQAMGHRASGSPRVRSAAEGSGRLGAAERLKFAALPEWGRGGRGRSRRSPAAGPGKPLPAPDKLLSSPRPAPPVATVPEQRGVSHRARAPPGCCGERPLPPAPGPAGPGRYLVGGSPGAAAAPSAGSILGYGVRLAGGRRAAAAASSASRALVLGLPPPSSSPPPRAPHGPLFMARGREPRTSRTAENVLRAGVRDRGPERESPGGAGPGAGSRDRERGSPGRRSLAERLPALRPEPWAAAAAATAPS